MPNRKTFDEADRYDHSSHSTADKEPGDLQAIPHGPDVHEADVPLSKPGGFHNDPKNDPNDPDEARQKFLKKNDLAPPK
jgi:hypothetical protein